MATFEVVCAGCGVTFTAKSSRAKWCTPGCKKRHQRKGSDQVAEVPPVETPPEGEPVHGLVASVRKELEDAGRLDTFSGQLALQLATRLSSPDESGISSLSKELRTVMAAALEGVSLPPAEDGQPEDDEEEDDVTRARRRREQARQEAGLA